MTILRVTSVSLISCLWRAQFGSLVKSGTFLCFPSFVSFSLLPLFYHFLAWSVMFLHLGYTVFGSAVSPLMFLVIPPPSLILVSHFSLLLIRLWLAGQACSFLRVELWLLMLETSSMMFSISSLVHLSKRFWLHFFLWRILCTFLPSLRTSGTLFLMVTLWCTLCVTLWFKV
jgi:hypothetical protein